MAPSPELPFLLLKSATTGYHKLMELNVADWNYSCKNICIAIVSKVIFLIWISVDDITASSCRIPFLHYHEGTNFQPAIKKSSVCEDLLSETTPRLAIELYMGLTSSVKCSREIMVLMKVDTWRKESPKQSFSCQIRSSIKHCCFGRLSSWEFFAYVQV